jgi:hypothetical protein
MFAGENPMKIYGWIGMDSSGGPGLIRALVQANQQYPIRLATWHYGNTDTIAKAITAIQAQPISGSHPFADSSANLAGGGMLIVIEPANIDYAADVVLSSWDLIHLELEINAKVQLVAYDGYCSVGFGHGISQDMLETFKQNDLIFSYSFTS